MLGRDLLLAGQILSGQILPTLMELHCWLFGLAKQVSTSYSLRLLSDLFGQVTLNEDNQKNDCSSNNSSNLDAKK